MSLQLSRHIRDNIYFYITDSFVEQKDWWIGYWLTVIAFWLGFNKFRTHYVYSIKKKLPFYSVLRKMTLNITSENNSNSVWFYLCSYLFVVMKLLRGNKNVEFFYIKWEENGIELLPNFKGNWRNIKKSIDHNCLKFIKEVIKQHYPNWRNIWW